MTRIAPWVGANRLPLAAWTGLALAVGVLLAVLPLGAAAQQIDGDVARGEQIYTTECAHCHGPDGRGGRTPGEQRPVPPIAGTDPVTVAYARLVMATGRMPPGGAPFDNRARSDVLDEQEQRDVLAFMVDRFGLTGDVPAPADGDASRGLELFARHCAACHGPTGQGGVAGGGAWTPQVTDVSAQTLADAIRVGPFQMPQFDRAQLSDADIADIAAFMEVVREEEATPLVDGELNPVFASGFAVLLAGLMLVALFVVAGKPAYLPGERPDTPQEPERTSPEPEDARSEPENPDPGPDGTDPRPEGTDSDQGGSP